MSDAHATESVDCFLSAEDEGIRLDRFLVRFMVARGDQVSRTQIQKMIRSGCASLQGERVRQPSLLLPAGKRLIFTPIEIQPFRLEPQKLDLRILFEDDHIIVINKVHGQVVHPGAGRESDSLVAGLLSHTDGNLSYLSGEDRPGIVHRLDRETSGCLVAAKSDLGYRSLVEQFAQRRTGKRYLAVVDGHPDPPAGELRDHMARHPVARRKRTIVEAPLGKEAVTCYRVIDWDQSQRWSILECRILTGRTHQIRVHCSERLRAPILGDEVYGHIKQQRVKTGRLMLHARELSFKHPATGEELTFVAEIPKAFRSFVTSLPEEV